MDYDDDDGIFVGHLIAINDSVGFHADSVAKLKAAFIESVDDYLEICEKVRREPNKP